MQARELKNAAINFAKGRMGQFELQLLNAGEADKEDAAEGAAAEKEAWRANE